MLVKTPETSWHDDIKPIMSIDSHTDPSTGIIRIATAGSDSNVRIWQLDNNNLTADGTPTLIFLANLGGAALGHDGGVNIVRFAPNSNSNTPAGIVLASAGDDGVIILWRLESSANKSTVSVPAAPAAAATVNNTSMDCSIESKSIDLTTEQSSAAAVPYSAVPTTATVSFGSDPADDCANIEVWSRLVQLRGHNQEIYDLAWSADSNYLLSSAIDRVVILWNMNTRRLIERYEDHSSFVQGIAFDPLNQYIASQSTDRTVKIYQKQLNSTGNNNSAATVTGAAATSNTNQKEFTLFKTLRSRRAFNAPATSKQSKKSADNTTPTATELTDNNMIDVDGADSPAAAASINPATNNNKLKLPIHPNSHQLYLDDQSVSTFFRRLTFSPDGKFLLTPTAEWQHLELDKTIEQREAEKLIQPQTPTKKTINLIDSESDADAASNTDADCQIVSSNNSNNKPVISIKPIDNNKSINCTLLFSRYDFTKPVAYLPYSDASIAVKFCPNYFHCRNNNNSTSSSDNSKLTSLPYRLVFAVATTKGVCIYDTESYNMLAYIKHIHHSAITDLTWITSKNSINNTIIEPILLVSSTDGYCTLIKFINNELGECYNNSEMIIVNNNIQSKRQLIIQRLQDNTAALANTAAALKKATKEAAKLLSKPKKNENEATNPASDITNPAVANGATTPTLTDGSTPTTTITTVKASTTAPTVSPITPEIRRELLFWLSSGIKITKLRIRTELKLSHRNAKRVQEEIKLWPEFKSINGGTNNNTTVEIDSENENETAAGVPAAASTIRTVPVNNISPGKSQAQSHSQAPPQPQPKLNTLDSFFKSPAVNKKSASATNTSKQQQLNFTPLSTASTDSANSQSSTNNDDVAIIGYNRTISSNESSPVAAAKNTNKPSVSIAIVPSAIDALKAQIQSANINNSLIAPLPLPLPPSKTKTKRRIVPESVAVQSIVNIQPPAASIAVPAVVETAASAPVLAPLSTISIAPVPIITESTNVPAPSQSQSNTTAEVHFVPVRRKIPPTATAASTLISPKRKSDELTASNNTTPTFTSPPANQLSALTINSPVIINTAADSLLNTNTAAALSLLTNNNGIKKQKRRVTPTVIGASIVSMFGAQQQQLQQQPAISSTTQSQTQ